MGVSNTAAATQLGSTEGRIVIGIADYAVTSAGATLTTNGLGSCLGIALFDRIAGVAGLIHIMRPSPREHEDTDAAKFADSGIELVIDAMERAGASQHRIEAKLAGGSDMKGFSATERSIGSRNVAQAETTLAELDVPITGRDVGGDHGRSLHFDGSSGTLTVESSNSPKVI